MRLWQSRANWHIFHRLWPLLQRMINLLFPAVAFPFTCLICNNNYYKLSICYVLGPALSMAHPTMATLVSFCFPRHTVLKQFRPLYSTFCGPWGLRGLLCSWLDPSFHSDVIFRVGLTWHSKPQVHFLCLHLNLMITMFCFPSCLFSVICLLSLQWILQGFPHYTHHYV